MFIEEASRERGGGGVITADISTWTRDDIDRVSDAMPRGLGFNSLSASDESLYVILDVGHSLAVGDVNTVKQSATAALEAVGVPVGSMRLTAGYAGSRGPHILLVVTMEGDG